MYHCRFAVGCFFLVVVSCGLGALGYPPAEISRCYGSWSRWSSRYRGARNEVSLIQVRCARNKVSLILQAPMGPWSPPASIHLRWLWCALTVLRCAGVFTPEIVSRAVQVHLQVQVQVQVHRCACAGAYIAGGGIHLTIYCELNLYLCSFPWCR